ncbi:hypothetical protein HYV10_01985 [Candidatus Dependentiae bacterium]|nr:hypothetical protein [Candidatus Dependentiae bacterium]
MNFLKKTALSLCLVFVCADNMGMFTEDTISTYEAYKVCGGKLVMFKNNDLDEDDVNFFPSNNHPFWVGCKFNFFSITMRKDGEVVAIYGCSEPDEFQEALGERVQNNEFFQAIAKEASRHW